MSCSNCGASGGACCGGGTTCGHCDSDAFDSPCTDLGQGFPLSIKADCALPIYTPIPGIVGIWNGVEWLLSGDDSSSTDSSAASSAPVAGYSLLVYRRDGGNELFNGGMYVRTAWTDDLLQLTLVNPAGNPDTIIFGPATIDDPGGILVSPSMIGSLTPGQTEVGGFEASIGSGPNGLYVGSITLNFIGANNSPFVINFEITLAN